VINPRVLTRIEKRHHGVGLRIDAGEIRPFIRIAAVTRERQSIERVRAAVLARYDVFDMKGNERRRLLWYAAIFAGVPGAAADQIPNGWIHLPGMLPKKVARLGLDDGDQVDGFHEVFVLSILGGCECAVVGLTAQFLDVSLEFRVRA